VRVTIPIAAKPTDHYDSPGVSDGARLLTAPALSAVFIVVTRSRMPALMTSALYVFDDTLMAHLRTAMREGLEERVIGAAHQARD
jgi:hypothetical protein